MGPVGATSGMSFPVLLTRSTSSGYPKYVTDTSDAVACDYLMVDNHQNILSHKNCFEEPIGCGIMFRVQHLMEMNLYDKKFKYAEEKALRKKFLKNYKITRVPISLYRYRQHKNNRSKNKFMVKKYSSILK